MSVVRSLFRLQQRGMCVDRDKRNALIETRKEAIIQKERELTSSVGYSFNVNSPPQVMKFLYEDLKLPVQYHHKTGKPTADEKTLEKLFAKHANLTFNLVMELRGFYKDMGTYLNCKKDKKLGVWVTHPYSLDGKVRSKYNPCGTETGRSSCGKTYNNEGLDMQNVPSDLREMFVASEGYTFTMVDLWQAETWPVAALSGSQSFWERLTSGKKLHSLIGGWLADKPETDINEDEYYIGKRVGHAANYGIGPRLLSVLIKRPEREAKLLLQKYFSFAVEIENWHREIQTQLSLTRMIRTSMGRVRFFRGRLDDSTFRKAYAHNPQSTVADYLHLAMVKLEYLLPLDAFIVQEGFDSLIIQHRIEQKEAIDVALVVSFDKEIICNSKVFKIPIEIKREDVWKK